MQGVDENARGGAGWVGKGIIHNEALAQLQQDEDANQGDADQVGDHPLQLGVENILRTQYSLLKAYAKISHTPRHRPQCD